MQSPQHACRGRGRFSPSNAEGLGRHLGKLPATAPATLLTIFSGAIVGNVKLAINQADPRVGAYDELVEEQPGCDFVPRGVLS